MSQAAPAPKALRWALAVAAALVFALLLAETQWLRPGYGVGDETTQMRLLVAHWLGEPLALHWAQGSLHRLVLSAWIEGVGSGLGRLHVPGLAIFAVELAALWALAKRWFGEEAACWALLLDLLSASTWLRVRSLLTFQVVPLELLAFALASGRVRGWKGALALGAAASLLSLDYEAAMVAGPFVIVACAAHEPAFRRHLGWTLGGLLAGIGVIIAMQPAVVSAYAGIRTGVNLGQGAGSILAAWGRNLWQLATGGEPMPYLGIAGWPAWALWAWPAMGLGLVAAWRNGGRSLLLWAGAVVLITQASLSAYGVPAHRLCAAWPAFCLIGALGLQRLRRGLGSQAGWALGLLLVVGAAAEANAFYRHMAVHGHQVWARSGLMAEAATELRREHAAGGAAIYTGLMEVRYPDIRFHLSSLPAQGSQAAWVLLPPEFRQAAGGLAAQPRVWAHSPNDEPILAIRVEGQEAARFQAMEAGLRPLLDGGDHRMGQGSERDRAWLAAKPPPDLWSWSAVLYRDLRRAWEGRGMDRPQLDLLASRAPVSPGPDATVGRFLVKRDPALALRFLDRALTIDPLYSPAMNDRAKALDAAGRTADARQAREHWAESFRQGAWQIYD